MEATGRRRNTAALRHVSLFVALVAFIGTALLFSSSSSPKTVGVVAAAEPPAYDADHPQGGEGEQHAADDFQPADGEADDQHHEGEENAATGEEVVESDHQGEEEEDESKSGDDNGIADLLKLMTKDMHIDFAKSQLGHLSSVFKELTDHLHKSHELHAEGEGKQHPVLKKVFSKRTHDKMVNVLQKMYKDVPRDEINEQLHGVMSLIQNLKADPHASTDQLLQKTATHLGLELTPELFEDMKKHMSWATKLFEKLPLHLLNPQKAEEL